MNLRHSALFSRRDPSVRCALRSIFTANRHRSQRGKVKTTALSFRDVLSNAKEEWLSVGRQTHAQLAEIMHACHVYGDLLGGTHREWSSTIERRIVLAPCSGME